MKNRYGIQNISVRLLKRYDHFSTEKVLTSILFFSIESYMPSTASNKLDSFYYFAYGTYVDPDVMLRALAATAGNAVPGILSSHPALLPGYRLVCNAVSAEGPRLGRLNIVPNNLVPLDPSSAHPHHGRHEQLHLSGNMDAQEFVAAFRDGVRGMLYELQANMRTPLLQAVAREGSFNMYAMLTCYELNDVHHGTRAADAAMHEAFVIAALDLPLMEQKYLVEKMMQLQWMVLPPPQGVMITPGLTSVSPAIALTASVMADESNKEKEMSSENRSNRTAAKFRWPGLHWCNCINSQRVAPSCEYVAMIKKAYTEYLLLQTATEEDAEGEEKHKRNDDDAHGREGGLKDTTSYGQTVYHMVYLRTRDTAKDPMEKKTWYLAYGSNLSWEQVCLRIGPPYQRRAAKLRDYILVPNMAPSDHAKFASFGYYNVEPVEVRREKESNGLVKRHSTMPPYVCGAAYEISMAQMEVLDSYEKGYDRQLLRCTDLRDATAAPFDCWTFIATQTSEDRLPSREYLARVLEGADILPLEYMKGIRATPTNPQRSPRQHYRLRKEI